MDEESQLKKNFEDEMGKIKQESVLDPAFRKKKLVLYVIRTTLAVILFVFLWENQWVKWTLIAYVPLNLIGLISILGWNALLKRKISRTTAKLGDLDDNLNSD